MGTKEQLLTLLEKNRGTYFSGEDIAERLSVSRAAVWKAVKSLRAEGYRIDAVQNRGYCLWEQTDILSAQGIRNYLEPVCVGLELRVWPSLQSTNKMVREMAASGAREGYTVVANTQTEGRGRRGRSFFSPADTGVYMSLLLRPSHCASQEAASLTTMAAVAVCEAIEAVSGQTAQIKWVNDIYVSGKKVCGILTEASFGLEDGFLEYAVLGIGVNVVPPREGFPDELRELAGSVFTQPCSDGKNRLTAAILNRLMAYYTAPEKARYVQAYRARSLVIGKDIQVLSPEGTKSAHALDVDEDCHLIVRYDDGRIENLSYGEISIRLADSGAQRF